MTEAVQKEKVNSQGATAADMAASQTEQNVGIPKEPQDRKEPAKEVKQSAEQTTKAASTEATTQTQQQTQTQSTEAKQEKVSDWPQFQDAAIVATANVLKESGLTFEEAKSLFAKDGVLGNIDTAALEAKVGKDKAALAMMGVKDYQTRQQAQIDQTVKSVHEVFGGEAAFEKVKVWAVDKAKNDPAFLNDLNKYKDMFTTGGVSARAAARDLLQQYNASPETSGVQTKMIQGDKTVGTTSNESPLNRLDYMTLLKKAHKEGNRPEIARLDARRRAGIKLKI